MSIAPAAVCVEKKYYIVKGKRPYPDLSQAEKSDGTKIPTVCMKYLTIISGQLRLLHQFKSDFAHLLALDNLVIELPNA